MLRASLACLLWCVALAACTSSDPQGLESGFTTSTGTGEDTGTSGETETETETGDGDGDGDGDTGGGEPLRFVAAGSYESTVLALDLQDPLDVPPPEILASGTEIGALFGPTPFGTEALTLDGTIQQLGSSPEGVLEFSPLATQEGNWLHSVWFGDEGQNALLSVGADPLTGPDVLLWARYDGGELASSFDITPPTQPGGSVLILGRSPDSRWAVAAVNVQPNGIWDLYLLPIDTNPGETYYVDQLDLTGLPAVGVPGFLSLQLDNERVVYRKELLPDLLRPAAVGLDNPDGDPVSIWPSLPHTYSITAGEDASRLLVTVEGEEDYRELRLLELDGPTSSQAPITISEPEAPALENTQPALGPPTRGHGFDALGRIYYVHADTSLPELASVGISLVTVEAGAVAERLELADVPMGAQIDGLVFDDKLQLLGYRVHTTSASWISYVDLSADQPVSIRVDQDFEHFSSAPEDNAGYGWSADGSRIAIVGLQQGQATLHVAEIGDASGATVEIELPDVEFSPDFILDHTPQPSPTGDQIMVWYGTEAGPRGLIHALGDGTTVGQIVLHPQHSLTGGAYLPHEG